MLACTALVSLHSTHFKRKKKEKIFVQLKRVFSPISGSWPVILCIFSVVLYYFGVWRFVILIFSKQDSCSCYLIFFSGGESIAITNSAPAYMMVTKLFYNIITNIEKSQLMYSVAVGLFPCMAH